MLSILTALADGAVPKPTAVYDQHTPGVRIDYGPVYLSLSVAEAIDLVDAIIDALAELEKPGD